MVVEIVKTWHSKLLFGVESCAKYMTSKKKEGTKFGEGFSPYKNGESHKKCRQTLTFFIDAS